MYVADWILIGRRLDLVGSERETSMCSFEGTNFYLSLNSFMEVLFLDSSM